MPQMFPLLWFLLFISIISCMISMSSSIHFSSSLNKASLKNFNPSSHQFSWKW